MSYAVFCCALKQMFLYNPNKFFTVRSKLLGKPETKFCPLGEY